MSTTAKTALGLAVLTLAVYARTVTHDYIALDDPRYVLSNPMVTAGLSADGVKWAFANDAYAMNWHPLTWLSHQLDCELFGVERPGAAHAVNALLHAAATVLLLLALVRMTGALGPSAVTAGLFALHPLHVESVAWIAERKDVLSGVLWMATMLAYVVWVERRGVLRYSLLLVLLAAGLMAKPVLVTLPCALLLLDYWPLGRLGGDAGRSPRRIGRLVAEKLPLAAATVASSLVTMRVQQGAMTSDEALPLVERLHGAVVAYAAYLGDTVWPAGLAVFYPRWNLRGQEPLAAAEVVVAAAVLAVLSALVLWGTWRGRRYLLVGWLWYLGTLVPMIGIVSVGDAARADRYTYIPLIGVFAAAAWGGRDLAAAFKLPRRATVAAAAIVLAACTALTVRQLGHWKGDLELFGHTARVTERNALAHTILGAELASRERLDEALPHLETAVAIDPLEPDALRWLGRLHLEEGRPQEAIEPLRQILRVDPSNAEVHDLLARAYGGANDHRRALRHLSACLRAGPRPSLAVRAHKRLARTYLALGQPPRAVAQYEEVLRLRPNSRSGHRDFAWLLATDPRVLDPARAVVLATRACELVGEERARYLDVLAAAHAAAGDFPSAVEAADKALAAVDADDVDLREAIARRLQLYRDGRPFRE